MHDDSTLEHLRVLVVDDDANTLVSTAALLDGWGYVVATALDAPTTLRLAASFRPHAVIIDVDLPVATGWELVLLLRRLPSMSATMFIVLTNLGSDADRHLSLACGCHLHLIKPAEPRVLEEILARKQRLLNLTLPDPAWRFRPWEDLASVPGAGRPG